MGFQAVAVTAAGGHRDLRLQLANQPQLRAVGLVQILDDLLLLLLTHESLQSKMLNVPGPSPAPDRTLMTGAGPWGSPGGLAVALALAEVIRVRLTAAGLGQPATDHVADGKERGVEPDLLREKPVVVTASGLRRQARDQNPCEHDDVGVELGRLDRRLGLGGQ